jgi:phosphatidylglycerol:prolipoprotein diacylglycerol transferase
MYVIAIIVGIFLVYRETKRKDIDLSLDDILDFVLIAIPLGIIGARLYYVAFEWGSFAEDPLEIVKLWHGGLAIHGGMIGGAVALVIFSRWKKVSFWRFADVLAPALIIGQALGRFGNFMNGDAYGVPFSVNTLERFSWLKWFRFPAGTPAAQEYPLISDQPWAGSRALHPTMLYELILDLLIFALLWWWIREKKYKDGFVVSCYIVLYSLIRIPLEFVRGDALWLGPIRVAHIISGILIIGFGWFVLSKKLHVKEEE